MVALGVRGDEKCGSNMGRETFLLPVVWEKEPFEWKEIQYEWPVVAPETGKLETSYNVPFKGTTQLILSTFSDDFDSKELDLNWNFRRVPSGNMYSLTKRESHLRLNCSEAVISNRNSANFVGFRQTESDFEYVARMSLKSKRNGSEAGISMVQKDDNYLNFTIIKEEGSYFLQVVLALPNTRPQVLKKMKLVDYDGSINLQVLSRNHEYVFVYSMDNNELVEFHRTEAHFLLSKGYTGAFLGLYATSNGSKTKDFADFDFVEYKTY
jgi:alpha-N-arabinofuranosidase